MNPSDLPSQPPSTSPINGPINSPSVIESTENENEKEKASSNNLLTGSDSNLWLFVIILVLIIFVLFPSQCLLFFLLMKQKSENTVKNAQMINAASEIALSPTNSNRNANESEEIVYDAGNNEKKENQSDIDSNQIGSAASSSPMELGSMKIQVADWLKKKMESDPSQFSKGQIDGYVDTFMNNSINGNALINGLNDESLKNELRVLNFGHRSNILEWIKELKTM